MIQVCPHGPCTRVTRLAIPTSFFLSSLFFYTNSRTLSLIPPHDVARQHRGSCHIRCITRSLKTGAPRQVHHRHYPGHRIPTRTRHLASTRSRQGHLCQQALPSHPHSRAALDSSPDAGRALQRQAAFGRGGLAGEEGSEGRAPAQGVYPGRLHSVSAYSMLHSSNTEVYMPS